MRTWMNLLSLASIAYGSGFASTATVAAEAEVPTIADDTAVDLEAMAKISVERAGGVRSLS